MTATHISLDIETMGTRSGSAILSIGALVFDPFAAQVDQDTRRHFHECISLESCLSAGLTVDAPTIMWWMQQSDETRAEFNKNSMDSSLAQVLQWFAGWFRDARGLDKPIRVWAKDPDFDCVLLERAHHALALPVPWRYSEKRCVRTICESAGVEPNDYNYGTKHNALHDAMSQARAIQEARRRLRPLPRLEEFPDVIKPQIESGDIVAGRA